MYSVSQATSSTIYDFRKDFPTIAAPGMRRYLEEIVEAPPDDGDLTNLRWCSAKRYVRGLWGELKILQRDYRYCAATDDFETYDIKNWTRESVESYVEQRLDDIIESSTRDHPPFGADHFIETEIGIFDDERRDLLERVGAIEDARKLVHHMRADGAFDVAIERAVQLLFLRAIKAAQPEPSSETSRPREQRRDTRANRRGGGRSGARYQRRLKASGRIEPG